MVAYVPSANTFIPQKNVFQFIKQIIVNNKNVKILLLSCSLPFGANTIALAHSNDQKSIHVPHRLMSKYTVN